MSPRQWHTALSSYQYAKRSEMNPLWTSNIIAGIDQINQSVFLAYTDLLGTTYEDDCIATGFGAYLAIPILRNALENKPWSTIGEDEAVSFLEQCLRVLYYRDARSLDQVQMARVTKDGGILIGKPYKLASDWSIA